MLSHPSSVLTAVVALLVSCHAVIRCPQIPGLAGAPGLSGAGGVQVQPYMPCKYAALFPTSSWPKRAAFPSAFQREMFPSQ